MIQPITANQVIASRTRVANPYFAGRRNDVEGVKTPDAPVTNPVECPDCEPMPNPSVKGEKLDINFKGFGGHSQVGNKVNYFA